MIWKVPSLAVLWSIWPSWWVGDIVKLTMSTVSTDRKRWFEHLEKLGHMIDVRIFGQIIRETRSWYIIETNCYNLLESTYFNRQERENFSDFSIEIGKRAIFLAKRPPVSHKVVNKVEIAFEKNGNSPRRKQLKEFVSWKTLGISAAWIGNLQIANQNR